MAFIAYLKLSEATLETLWYLRYCSSGSCSGIYCLCIWYWVACRLWPPYKRLNSMWPATPGALMCGTWHRFWLPSMATTRQTPSGAMQTMRLFLLLAWYRNTAQQKCSRSRCWLTAMASSWNVSLFWRLETRQLAARLTEHSIWHTKRLPIELAFHSDGNSWTIFQKGIITLNQMYELPMPTLIGLKFIFICACHSFAEELHDMSSTAA